LYLNAYQLEFSYWIQVRKPGVEFEINLLESGFVGDISYN